MNIYIDFVVELQRTVIECENEEHANKIMRDIFTAISHERPYKSNDTIINTKHVTRVYLDKESD